MKMEEKPGVEEKPLPVRPIRWEREWPLRRVEIPEHYRAVEEYDPVLASHCRL